jgi:hypothetical protein
MLHEALHGSLTHVVGEVSSWLALVLEPEWKERRSWAVTWSVGKEAVDIATLIWVDRVSRTTSVGWLGESRDHQQVQSGSNLECEIKVHFSQVYWGGCLYGMVIWALSWFLHEITKMFFFKFWAGMTTILFKWTCNL